MDNDTIRALQMERDSIGKEIGKICRNIDNEKRRIKSLRKKEQELKNKIAILKYE